MILIRNATLVEFDVPRVRTGDDVLIHGDRITAVGPDVSKASAGEGVDRTIDATGRLLFPGNVCSHHHYYSGLARGILAEIGATPDFLSILKNLWWRMDRALDEPSLYASALVCSLDAIRCGTTTVIDHHSSPTEISGALSTIQRAFEEIGLRGTTCYEVTDRNGPSGLAEGVEENRRFAAGLDEQKSDGSWSGLVEAHIGGHAPFTLPDAALAAISDVAKESGRGFHVHIAEDPFDVTDSKRRYGKGVAARLDEYGLIDESSILGHGTHLEPGEIELVNSKGAYIVHNARSNMNNGVGYNSRLADIDNLALGTDGIGADMFEETKFAYFKHRDVHGQLWLPDFLGALGAGNRIVERVFEAPFGRIEAGYKADLVLGDYQPPTPLVPENAAGHFVFGMGSGVVDTVIVNGNIVMENRVFPIDVSSIYENARHEARRIWARMNEIDA